MLIPLFSVLIGLSLILIWLGYYTKEGAYSLVGFFFLFILGFWVIFPGNLQYESGTQQTYTYICYGCDGNSFPSLAGNTSQVSSIITENTYTSWNDTNSRFIGVWLAVIGAVGIAINLSDIRRGFKND